MQSDISVEVGTTDNPPPDEVAQLKTRIMDMLRWKGPLTFAEVCRVPGFQGEETLFAAKPGGRPIPNCVVWVQVSRAAIAAVGELIAEGQIHLLTFEPLMGIMTYGFDGKVLDLPVATSVRRRGYRRLRWVPVYITTPGWLEACDKLLRRSRLGRPPAYASTRGRGKVGR